MTEVSRRLASSVGWALIVIGLSGPSLAAPSPAHEPPTGGFALSKKERTDKGSRSKQSTRDEGDPESKGKKKKKKKKDGDSGVATPSDGTSRSIRATKHVMVAAEGGFVLNGGAEFGGRAGFFLGPQIVIEGGLVYGSYLYYKEQTATLTLLEGRVKFFVGNSFYGIAGAGYRIFKGKTDVEGPPPKLEADANYFSRVDIGLDAGLGSQWQMGGLTLGVESSFYFPAKVMSHIEDASPFLTADQQTKALADFNRVGAKPMIHLLRGYVGFAF